MMFTTLGIILEVSSMWTVYKKKRKAEKCVIRGVHLKDTEKLTDYLRVSGINPNEVSSSENPVKLISTLR